MSSRFFKRGPSGSGPSGMTSLSPLFTGKAIWAVGIAAAAVVVLGIGYGPHPGGAGAAPAERIGEDGAVPVTFFYAERGKPQTELILPASLQALQDTTIYARTNGYLKRWLVDFGDKVKTGQLLAEIETPELDQELQEAQAKLGQVKANLDVARVTAERYQALRGDDAVAPQEVDEKVGQYEARKADYVATQAQIKRLQELRSFQRVVAPFSGTITARNIEVGSLIASGSASASGWLFKLQHTETMRVFVNVPQNYFQLVKPGMTGDLSVREVSDKAFPCKVTRHAGSLDPATRTVLVELQVPNKEGALLAGMYGQLKFHLVNPQPNIVIPGTALIVGGEGMKVAILGAGDVVHVKQVRIGRDFGKEVEIVEGLGEKDRVVNNPRDTLQDGSKVKAVLMEKKSEKKDAKPAEKGAEKPKA